MKTCPTCNRTYADDSQRFCLNDGTPLVGAPDTGPLHGAPQPQPQQPQPPPQYPQAGSWTPPGSPPPGAAPPPWQQPAPKRKIWPWVLGIVAVLGIGLVAIIGIIGYVAYKSADNVNRRVSNLNVNSSNTGGVADADDVDISGTELYVNSREGQTGNLSTHYVDFSFRYPDTWKLDPSPAPSFVRVERANGGGGTIENFSVGWFSATGSVKGNRALLSQVVNNLSGQISGNFPDYEKVSEGFAKFGKYDGYELRFARGAGAGGASAVKYWGRVVVIPDPAGGKDGVSVIMLATSNSDEVDGPSDLGIKGELPVIVKTFKFGT